jgi:hypothetical protein
LAVVSQFDQIPFEGSKAFRVPSDDIELTLRPGESWPMDSVRVQSGTKMQDGRTCRGSVSIRASVEHYPSDDRERRLVAADLWLVERLPNGTEVQRSQPLSVRGLPNRAVEFYFDNFAEANASLDIYGNLTARIESGAIAVSVETRSRWNDNGPQGFVDSAVQAKPGEMVEIRLPKLIENAGPFANRQFSIRIRARQLR